MHGHALVIIGILELPIHQAAIRRSIQEQHGSDVTGLGAIHATGHIIRGCFPVPQQSSSTENVCTQRKRLHSLRQKCLSFSPREGPSESVKTSTNGPVPRATAPNPVLYSSLAIGIRGIRAFSSKGEGLTVCFSTSRNRITKQHSNHRIEEIRIR